METILAPSTHEGMNKKERHWNQSYCHKRACKGSCRHFNEPFSNMEQSGLLSLINASLLAWKLSERVLVIN
jgi:hypothetical protein